MLTGSEIIARVFSNEILIEPFDQSCAGPNSYDLTLAPTLLEYRELVLDPRRKPQTETITIPEEGLILFPGKLYLGATVEKTGSSKFVPMLCGRSSIGRLGISVHVTAGLADLGWYGTWTLEISVAQPVRIYPGMRVCQVTFHPVVGAISLYRGHYQDQKDPEPFRLWLDSSEKAKTTYPIVPSAEQLKVAKELIPEAEMFGLLPWDPRYVVSDTGCVVSFIREPAKKLSIQNSNLQRYYPSIRISGRVHSLHRLVAAVFYGPPQQDQIVRHLNDDASNFNLANLVYGTKEENAEDKRINGNSEHKLSDEDVLEVFRLNMEVSKALSGKNWKSV